MGVTLITPLVGIRPLVTFQLGFGVRLTTLQCRNIRFQNHHTEPRKSKDNLDRSWQKTIDIIGAWNVRSPNLSDYREREVQLGSGRRRER